MEITEKYNEPLEPFEDFLRLLKALKATRELAESYQQELYVLIASEAFRVALQTLKEDFPETYEELRRKVIGEI